MSVHENAFEAPAPKSRSEAIWNLQLFFLGQPWGPFHTQEEIIEALRAVRAIEAEPWTPAPEYGEDCETKGGLGGLASELWEFACPDEGSEFQEGSEAVVLTRQALALLDHEDEEEDEDDDFGTPPREIAEAEWDDLGQKIQAARAADPGFDALCEGDGFTVPRDAVQGVHWCNYLEEKLGADIDVINALIKQREVAMGTSSNIIDAAPHAPAHVPRVDNGRRVDNGATGKLQKRRAATGSKTAKHPNEDLPKAPFVCQRGTVRPLLANAELMLRKAAVWQGVLAFNEFTLEVQMLKAAPWPGAKSGGIWTDHEDRKCAIWLQQHEVQISDEVAGKAALVIARDNPFHPVRDYLDSLQWDGTNRIDSWLVTYLGATPNAYNAAVGARWLMSGVARIYKPGAKVDSCLILEGPQGAKKSTALRTLADPWFTDEIAELGSKDAALQTRGVWIIELSELDAMSGAEVAKVKSFMSRCVDRFRPPFGRRLIDSPRQCIFAGTVNHGSYLKDETGARRFWPVACGTIRIDELARDRDLLWAEAAARYRAGCAWWLDSRELNQLAAQEQGDRYEGDAWDALIAEWVCRPTPNASLLPNLPPLTSTPESVTIPDILINAIGKRPETWTQSDKNRIARSLRALGYERYRERSGDVLEWRYRKPQ